MSTMKNYSRSFLGRLALCGLAAPLILLFPALVRADAITTFDVSGTATNISGMKLNSCAAGATCAFSGSFQVDTTTGTVESSGFDITLPGLPRFNVLPPFGSGPFSGVWGISAFNGANFNESDELNLAFETAPIPASLMGFTGGSIFGFGDILTNYTITGGSITPAPEPSSLVLFASGLLVFGLTRRFGKKVGHPLSA